MKKKVLLIFFVMLSMWQSAFAYDFSAIASSGQLLYYSYIYGSTGNCVSVTYPGDFVNPYSNYNKPSGALIIPSSVSNGNSTYYVTKIGSKAFSGCSGLTSVAIPDCVTSIGSSAFSGCTGLTSVNIPDSVISIGNTAFSNCYSLTYVSIPNLVTSIGSETFYNCASLTSVFIPNSITSIGDYAFCDCIDLTSVDIPSSVTSIGTGAFCGCTGLASITIPNFITSIGEYVFVECTSLTSVTIGSSVTNIGYNAFYGCNNINEITSYATMAPLLGMNAFYGVPSYAFVNIPCGSLASYNSRWSSYFNNFIEPPAFMIGVISADETVGQVDVIMQPTCQSPVAEIQATPTYGHHFTYWNDGVTENPRTITLTQDTSFTAYFAPNQYTITVNANEHGTATGGGTYTYGDTISIQAFPDEHYHFVRWSDGNYENPRRYCITGDITMTAFLFIDTHTVSVVSSDIIRGMVEASGTEFAYGTPCTVTATAYTGYTFAGWSNGVTANPYTFAVISDVELTALFVEEGEEVYTVTVESADPTMGTVSGGGQALSGGTVIISAIPNDGYRFVSWQDGNTENPRVVTVTGNVTYTAYFESTQGIRDIDGDEVKIYASEGRIVVESGDGESLGEVRVFDVMGRNIAAEGDAAGRVSTDGMKRYTFEVPTSGTYVVKIGDKTSRKIVVIK